MLASFDSVGRGSRGQGENKVRAPSILRGAESSLGPGISAMSEPPTIWICPETYLPEPFGFSPDAPRIFIISLASYIGRMESSTYMS